MSIHKSQTVTKQVSILDNFIARGWLGKYSFGYLRFAHKPNVWGVRTTTGRFIEARQQSEGGAKAEARTLIGKKRIMEKEEFTQLYGAWFALHPFKKRDWPELGKVHFEAFGKEHAQTMREALGQLTEELDSFPSPKQIRTKLNALKQ